MKKIRVALYARVSTAGQDVEMQMAELRAKASHMGWDAVEFVDVGSGKTAAKLPQRARLMEEARLGRIAAVVVWRFDRFARSVSDLLRALEDFRKWNVQFVSLRDAVDTSTPTGQLLFTLIGAIAEFERELIRARVIAGLQNARAKGARIGRRRLPVELPQIVQAMKEATSMKEAAKRLKVSTRTLRRRLSVGGQNPPEKPLAETRQNAVPRPTQNGEGEK